MSEVVGAKGRFFDGERWILDVGELADDTVQAIFGLTLPVGTKIEHVQFHYRRGRPETSR